MWVLVTEYKKCADQEDNKKFYADVPMTKPVWIAEISTYKFYELWYAFADVLDATASNLLPFFAMYNNFTNEKDLCNRGDPTLMKTKKRLLPQSERVVILIRTV